MDGEDGVPVLEQGEKIALDEATSCFELEHWGGDKGRWVLIGQDNEYFVDPSQVVVNEVHEIER